LIQRYRHRDHPDWERAVGVDAAAGIDYLIGVEGLTGRGLGSAAIRRFTADTFEVFSDVEAICAVPQQANVASWRALEKAGFRREQTVAKIESDDPADDGPAFIYVKRRTR
jgi:aminoglycoside 6'-N-acetyltransferase